MKQINNINLYGMAAGLMAIPIAFKYGLIVHLLAVSVLVGVILLFNERRTQKKEAKAQ